MEKAIEVLRKQGAAKAEKKSGRATKEGKILAKIEGNQASLIEVLCETDFVATNEKFINFVQQMAGDVLKLDGDGCVTEAAQAAEKAEKEAAEKAAQEAVEAPAETEEK